MKKNYAYFLLTLLFIITTQAFSQHSVRGKLIDENLQPVAFANVILLSAQDSVSVYKGTVSEENGAFEFQNVNEDKYLLKTSFVGFEDHHEIIDVSKDLDLYRIEIRVSSSELDEVTIQARKPTITRSIDRITFDVENSTLSSGNSWDVLKQTPGVIINQGQLQVRNGGVTVYINDRKVQLTADELTTLLQSYSAENLKSVEVITNPPARYDAEGGAIININTTKALNPGYKGSLEGNYTQGIVPKYQIGTSHYWKGEKLNFFANYSFSPRKEIKRDDSYINFISPLNAGNSHWETDFERVTRSRAHNANVMLDYDFDEKNRLSFSSNLMVSPNKTFDNRVNTEIENAQQRLQSSLFTESELENDESNIALNLGYTHSMDNGGSFSSNLHYTRFDQDRMQMVETDYFNAAGDPFQTISFNTDAAQEIDIVTAQIDFNSPLGSTNFDAGAKLSTINSSSGIDFSNAESLEDLYENLSDDFRYDEMVYAAYANISKDWESWSIQAGLRGEYTDLEGHSLSMDEVNSQEYFELFPTAYLQYRASDDHSFTLDYSRRIERPRYESLNPFRYFLNENDFNAGNPNLKAAISDNFNLNYTLKGSYFFDVYYRDYGNSPATLAFQNNDRQFIRRVSMNLLEDKTYGLDITHVRMLTDWWYAQLYASIFHEENRFAALESEIETHTNEVDGVLAQLYNSFTLTKDGSLTGTLTYLYVSDYMSGSYNFEPFSTLSIGLRKTLWNNRAELSLNVNDIFDQTNTRLTSRYANQDNSFFAREEMRYVRLGFKYNFGNFRLEDNQRSIEAAERDRL
ncbi:outer membrane beta-barrel family protein [Salegentibacter flavus]|uniref:Outer membrane receptor proteins, mostly Fe transport n=1 Tax=Salegentibacter flavus TaxID=287099 RepID=A0A1I5A3U3_9FLAO|nr:outer membrane beta-barrel family protein [Salegentibacter flavus]SFN57162.1 Outer membrane receptor proteins, mostly Fe transport [Salegentibacter flavus]